MLSGIHGCDSLIETLLLFYPHSFGFHHDAAGLHDINVSHRDYDQKYPCRKHPIVLLCCALSMYDAWVDARADIVERVVGWQRQWLSEEASRRAHMCSRAYDRCQSFLAISMCATLHWRI